MNRAIRVAVGLFLVAAFCSSPLVAQMTTVGMTVGTPFGYGYAPYGMGYGGFGYGGFAPGWGGWGGYGGFGAGLGQGFGPYGLGYGGWGSYGAFAYSQQSFRQQALLTQGIFIAQQQALLGQLDLAQARLEKLDAAKQQLFKRYLDMNETDKAAVRRGLVEDYLQLDPARRDGWKRDAVVQLIIGQDVLRLDGVAEFRAMDPSDQTNFRSEMLAQYRSLPAEQQRAWQNDQVIGLVMGRNWWQQ